MRCWYSQLSPGAGRLRNQRLLPNSACTPSASPPRCLHKVLLPQYAADREQKAEEQMEQGAESRQNREQRGLTLPPLSCLAFFQSGSKPSPGGFKASVPQRPVVSGWLQTQADSGELPFASLVAWGPPHEITDPGGRGQDSPVIRSSPGKQERGWHRPPSPDTQTLVQAPHQP